MKLLALKIGGGDNSYQINPPPGIRTGGLPALVGIIQNAVKIFLIFLMVLSLFFLVFGGIKWVTSQGDKAKIESARTQIIYAALGLFISLAAFWIIYAVLHFFHLESWITS